jgi:YD repeat-containing protein
MAILDFSADSGTTYYYDASGQLVAVVDSGVNVPGPPTCVAGPADGFAVQSCQLPIAGSSLDCGATDAVVM